MSYRISHVADKSILFVMAASAEYGPHLQARIAPLMTGVGPVEAAISVTAILAGLDAAAHLPDLVVSLGSAGSRTLDQTGIYQATSVSYRDMDASAFGFEKGRTPFLDLPAEVALPLRIPDIAEARLSTGANVVSGAAYGAIDADMVEMETYAVLRACQRFGVPLVSLRGISDGKADVNHVDDWTEYLHIIDEKLADAVDRLCRAIEDGVIAL
ncbi:5'-methylthioadenosine/S-adenosylhomocysteine nucleosidase [Rhizobium oryzihabitans]|uniref:5'-methylthioadenosine/S-adenosylhomocysteine nucleosidase n=1 Tax=Rhizobium oryzihabitans TaxID=2267833 RepID=A0A7L5BHI1_9HYPH|nr:5'-methylthioadenosine/S-adenosylhomocysteine nucleosidase [Rhizobium oryzihabitans]QCM06329.1 5'-methylthioadenosine/S-adenosylhomocysteine nucleosidase [Agrobacterium tumefaciens]QIB38292.1 5'-methylthioadenosine/S-adenosylhomocysteine nucleosidase [Rhizobium oryzihabitans]CUX39775.1 5'-methylthioadenosine/S-adenosylhomocysteine nucleosidase [Agrobacterium genomosp. 5 str. CFBP 6626]